MVLPKNKFAKYWSMRFYLGVPLCATSNSLQKPCFFRARRARAILSQGPARLRALRASEWPCSLLESDSGPYCNHFLDPYKMQIAPLKHTLRQLTIYFAWKIIVTKHKNWKISSKSNIWARFFVSRSPKLKARGPRAPDGHGPPAGRARPWRLLLSICQLSIKNGC